MKKNVNIKLEAGIYIIALIAISVLGVMPTIYMFDVSRTFGDNTFLYVAWEIFVPVAFMAAVTAFALAALIFIQVFFKIPVCKKIGKLFHN